VEYHCQRLPLSSTGAFSSLFLDYMEEHAGLKPFYNEFPKIESFGKLIRNKCFSTEKRTILVNELKKQYSGIENPPEIDLLLNEKTFAVTSGHQLNIFTGPLYIPFKIITIINLATKLKEAYPEYNFVPVYWMASEDHDLAEIQSARAFGKKVYWETAQTGAVGRMSPKGLPELAHSLGASAEIFKKAYTSHKTLADAVRDYVHCLFGKFGLITIDADCRSLKTLFSEVIKDDLINNSAFRLVNEQTQKLEQLGYKTQISAREINFFYLDENLRERIIKEDEHYKVLNSNISFSEPEILELIATAPERFSPNVVLRPLYEEMILPNLAYIGGPSEVPYWLQLKSVFDFYKEEFPALIPRNFGMLVNQEQLKSCQELNVSTSDFFTPLHKLEELWIKKHSEKQLSLQDELERVQEIFNTIEAKASEVDHTLIRTGRAFNTKTIDLIERLQKKMIRAEKRKHAEKLQKLTKLKESLFPSDGLQERKENIIPFLEANPGLIEELIKVFDPLDFRFNIIEINT
jgi:bacillithiol biosynthesis cysteine-adding enzyme BshC